MTGTAMGTESTASTGAVLAARGARGRRRRGAGFTLIELLVACALMAVLAVGIWWVRGAYLRYKEAPDTIETRELVYKTRFRQALLVWAGVAFGAIVLTAVSGTDFWCWPIWVAGGTWALAVKVEQHLAKREEFQAPTPVTSEAG